MNKKILKTVGIISVPIMYIIFFLAIKYISFLRFSYDLLFFATIAIAFVSLHFFLDVKKMYEWMFKFRYLIGIIVFSILVAGGYHGSSIGVWNSYVNPNTKVTNGIPVLGIPRGTRSDEWLVNTPNNLSQSKNDFATINSMINAKENKVSFYPRLIVKDMGMVAHPEQWGYLFLPLKNAFSFQWYFSIFAGFFVALELFMIITKKNRLYSTLGAFLLVISSPAFWWNNCAYTLYGGLALIIIDKFINIKKISSRVLLALALGVVAACYVLIMYPAWMIPYAYFFALLFIWILIENKDKIKWKDLLYLLITALVCAGIFLPLYLESKDIFDVVSNTVYPGNRVSYGGGSWNLLFTYVSNVLFPYVNIGNPCEYSQYLSLFPLPIIMGIYYLIVNKKKNNKIDWFLLLTSVFVIGLTIWCALPLPKFLSKITLLTMSTSYRAQLVVGYACIFLLVYIMSKYETVKKIKFDKTSEMIKMLVSLLIALVISWYSATTINSAFENCINMKINFVMAIIFAFIFYLLFRNNKKTNLILAISLIAVNMLSSFIIAPIAKGLNVLYEKPFAKEIQEIVKKEPGARFMAVDSSVLLANYILVNGGASIVSTNYIPNLELWHKLDPEEKYNEVYNRYSHIVTILTTDKTSFSLVQDDMFTLNLNYDDICKLDVDYIASIKKQKENPNYYTEIYNFDDTYIYKTNCN